MSLYVKYSTEGAGGIVCGTEIARWSEKCIYVRIVFLREQARAFPF